MSFPLIAAIIIAAGVAGLFAWILAACRMPKSRDWQARHVEALHKAMPSFDIYSSKGRRSMRIAAASKRE